MTELKNILKKKYIDDLKYFCELYGVNLEKNIKKKDIVGLLDKKMRSSEALDYIYVLFSDEEIENLKLASSGKSYDIEKLLVFDFSGYIIVGDNMLISDVIVKYINQRHPKLEAKRKQYNTLFKYFEACANLYGIVPIEIPIDLYNKYEHKKFQKREIKMLEIADVIKPFKFFIEDGQIIHEDVFITEDSYDDLLKEQSGKPYAILPKEELLKYTDPDYFERTPQYNRMVTMLSLTLGISRSEADEVADDLAIMAKVQMNFDHIFEYLERYGITFSGKDEYGKFLSAYTELSNNSRIWENRGCTPVEIRKRMINLHNENTEDSQDDQ